MTADPTSSDAGPLGTGAVADLLPSLAGPIFRDALEGMIVMSRDEGVYLEVNEAFCRLVGRPRDEIVGRTPAELQILPDPDQRTELRRRLEQAGFAHMRVDISTADGRSIIADTNVRLVDVDGHSLIFSTLVDIGERDAAVRSLEEAERRYRHLVETIPAVVWLDRIDEESTNVYMSPQVEEMLGYPLSAWEEDPLFWKEILFPEDQIGRIVREEILANLRRYSIEFRMRAADGRTVWVYEEAVPVFEEDGTPQFWQGVWFDVTERHEVTESLRQAERRFRSLVEAIPAVVYLDLLDEESTNLYTSPQAEETFGYPMSEWVADPKKWIALLHPDDRDRVLAEQAAQVREPERFVSEYRMIAKDGHVVWVHDEAVPLAGDDGTPAYWQGVWFDVTPRREAEAALRESEQLFRLVVDNATDLIALIDPDGTLVYTSPSHETVIGYRPEELIGRSAFAFNHPEDDRRSRDSFAQARTGVQAPPPASFRLLHKDGHAVDLEGVGWQPLFGDDGEIRYFLTISRDITQRRRAEEERRALLARVVDAQEDERRRIAVDVHDDPLQAVTALGLRLELLRPHVDPEGAELLGKLGATVERAQTSMRTLLFELRPPSLDAEGLSAAIREDLRLTGEGLRSEVVDDMAGGDPPPAQRIVLYRVAREALVNVRKHANASRVWVHLGNVEGGTLLRVEDDGSGVRAEDGDEPHYGVSMMRERAELAGGWLRLSPRPEGGTIVECWIPT
jgi:PAS domain S-box-containing protein